MLCILHGRRIESVLKKGFHRVNNSLSTGFVKSHYNYTLIKRILNIVLKNVHLVIIFSFSFVFFLISSYAMSMFLLLKFYTQYRAGLRNILHLLLN
jgi:hypothetical protein